MKSRNERLKRIGERIAALVEVGFYDEPDRESLRSMCKNGMALVDIEMVLYLAEQDVRDSMRKAQDAQVAELLYKPGDEIKYGPRAKHPIPPLDIKPRPR